MKGASFCRSNDLKSKIFCHDRISIEIRYQEILLVAICIVHFSIIRIFCLKPQNKSYLKMVLCVEIGLAPCLDEAFKDFVILTLRAR